MFMGLVMLLPIALLTAVGGWMTAFAMLRKGHSLRMPILWMAIGLAIAIGALTLFSCLARQACQAPAGFEEQSARMIMILAYAGLPLIPLVGGFLAGMVLGGLAWQILNGRRA